MRDNPFLKKPPITHTHELIQNPETGDYTAVAREDPLAKDVDPEVLRKYLMMLQRKAELDRIADARVHFLSFVKEVWPSFIAGRHHKIVAEKFEQIAQGKLKRLIINMPPRHTKSEFASYLFPAWFMGLRPDMKIMQATHTADLAIRFGRKVKSLLETEEYHKIFKTKLRQDSKAAFRWETDGGGEYYATGVGGSIAGRGADLFVIDDPHSEQDAMSPTALEAAWEWYQGGPRQRLQPGGAIVVVMTRWSTIDMTAKLLKQMGMDPKADRWEVIEFPAILPSGNALWPEFWKLEELEGVKASISLQKWQAQYMQSPVNDAASIVKRTWWKTWKSPKPPKLHYIMQSYDTAFGKGQESDFSAIQTWGVFYPEEGGPANLILMDAKKGRWEFPELKKIAFQEYKYWEPETILIEAKAAGMPLTQELRRTGIPVVNFSPSRGNDKMTRVNSVAPLFEAGMIWAPEASWAEEVIEEFASFPFGENDDMVDAGTQALMRFRAGGFIAHPSDPKDIEELAPKRRVYY
jgi:predicted phage terminase large subunit-like protein